MPRTKIDLIQQVRAEHADQRDLEAAPDHRPPEAVPGEDGKGMADYSEQMGESATTRWTRRCPGSNGNWRTLTMVRRCCPGPGGSTARGSETD